MRFALLLLFGFASAALVAAPANAQMSYGKAPMVIRDPELPGQAKIEPKLGAHLPLDEIFYDHDGKAITLKDAMGGKPTLLILAYSSCPKLCNELLNDTVSALRSLARLGLVAGKDYQVVRVSIDPKEAPTFSRKMRESYLGELDKRSPDEPGFWFLTANHGQGTDVIEAREKIQRVADAVGFRYAADNQAALDEAAADRMRLEKVVRKTREFVHASALFIVSPDGTLSTVLQGLKRSPELPAENGWTAEDIRQALLTAADGKLGTAVQRLAMLCFAYDSTSGHYRPTMRAMGLFALPFPFIIGLIAYSAWRRSRTEKKLTPADVVPKPGEPGVYPAPSLN
ncbi:SCO family protein [Limnoglobus roseus]|uniref:SCO family protein n=1 Tax=Limnoglobus roseus TaxID=2598579 RepID=A0A5C1A7T3_9BACT|nr:SCO family protein [Limnoglobus roseus]QEL15369.1 SCO family protein [Limnoglobus roseus]